MDNAQHQLQTSALQSEAEHWTMQRCHSEWSVFTHMHMQQQAPPRGVVPFVTLTQFKLGLSLLLYTSLYNFPIQIMHVNPVILKSSI